MITTLSKQGGLRYPQMGGTSSIFVGRLLSVGGTASTSQITKWGNMPRRRKNELDDDADIREIVEIALRAFGE